MSVQGKIAESGQIAEQTAPGVSVPAPWKIGGKDWLSHSCCFDAVIVGFRDGSCVSIAEAHDPADAAFIVRAVNSHDALVKALEEMIEVYWGDGDGELPEPHCIQNARAALASAREVQP